MKINVKASDLSKALKSASRVIERKNTIPILGNVLIRGEGSKLVLKATNLDLEISLDVPAEVVAAGETTVSASIFESFVSKVPRDATIKLEQKDATLSISAGRPRCSLHTLPTSDYPDLSAGDLSHRFEMTQADFLQLVKRCKFAISTEETRYYLNGIYFHVIDGKLTCVATDGHRLAKVQAPAPAGSQGMPGIIVPRQTAGVAIALSELAEAADKIEISLSSTKIVFSFGTDKLVSKLTDAQFPDYERAVPTGNNDTAIVSRPDLADSADRVSTIASDRGRAVKLDFAAGSALKLSVSNADKGEAQDEVEVDYGGPGLTIRFNSRYLAEILREIPGDKCRIAMSDPGSPTLFSEVGDSSATFVLMPMRV